MFFFIENINLIYNYVVFFQYEYVCVFIIYYM